MKEFVTDVHNGIVILRSPADTRGLNWSRSRGRAPPALTFGAGREKGYKQDVSPEVENKSSGRLLCSRNVENTTLSVKKWV